MSVVRITTVTCKSQQAADTAAQSYKSNAVGEFSSASQFIRVTGEDIVIATSSQERIL